MQINFFPCQKILNTNQIFHFHNPKNPIPPEVYLVEYFIKIIKNDNRSWPTIVREYFCIKDYDTDFRIEWEKRVKLDTYQNTFQKRKKNWNVKD